MSVQGAVSEYEREKILERTQRGRQLKLQEGKLILCGIPPLGYNYIRKSKNRPGHLVINPEEAQTVRTIFEMYAKPEVTLPALVKYLENHGIKSKRGSNKWERANIKAMLQNTTYYGVKYQNKTQKEIIPDNSGNYLRKPKFRIVKLPKEEWLPAKVPAIISKDLFDQIQAKFEDNRKELAKYTQRRTYLLVGLLKCGVCGYSTHGYFRRIRYKRNGIGKIHHKYAYKCNKRNEKYLHADKAEIVRCDNPEVSCHKIDGYIWKLVGDALTDPDRLVKYIKYFRHGIKGEDSYEKKLTQCNRRIKELEIKKKKAFELYTGGYWDKERYIQQDTEFSCEIESLKQEKNSLTQADPAVEYRKKVFGEVLSYCAETKRQHLNASGFQDKRQFLLDHIERIIFTRGKATVIGTIPIDLGVSEDIESLGNVEMVKEVEFKFHGQVKFV